MDCIFCRIVKGEIPSYKIYEDKNYLAFLDISQFTPGHTIVIPKKHLEFIWDSKEIGKYFGIVKKIARHFRSLGYTFVDSLTFGRKVPHAHVHLVPHNGNSLNYKKALERLGDLQSDTTRHPSPELGKKLVKKFKVV